MSRALTVAVALLASTLLVPLGARADSPTAPTRWVTDEAGFLSGGTSEALDRRLEEYERRSGHQVLVWIGRSAGGVPIEDFAVRAFAAWRVGRKGLDDGVVVFVFSQDREVRIEVGYGLEGQVPDAIASRIIGETIVPRMQAGDRDGAVTAGVEALIAAIDGKTSETESRRSAEESPASGAPSLSTVQKVFVGLAVLAFLALLVTHPSLALYLLFTILSGGRGGGGSGGRGRYSGGGGRSGGGGASGRW